MPTNNALFDRFAPNYDRVIGAPDPERLRHFLRLPAAGWMLDAGGGTGRASAPLAPLVSRLVISDLSLPMLGAARVKGFACPVQTHVEALPFPDAHFDRVLVVDALHHFCNQQQSIAELARVLRPGGRLVIEEPDINRWGVKLIALAEKLALMGSHFHSPAAIRDMVQAHGLQATVASDGTLAAWIIADK